jgi:hypothetical protein
MTYSKQLLAGAALAVCVSQLLAASPSASAQAQARYRDEMARCNSGQSHQTIATCRQEAGAALAEARRGGAVQDDPVPYQSNALQRCAVHQGDDRAACESRIRDQGDITPGVEAGGLLRQSITVTPAQ